MKLSPDEISFVERGLNFGPINRPFDKNKLAQGIFQFARHYKVKEFFLDKNCGENSTTIATGY